MQSSLRIRALLCELPNVLEIPLFRDLVRGIEPARLQNINDSINRMVDFDAETDNKNRTIIMQGIDEELDLLKQRYHGLHDFLGRVAIRVYQSLKGFVSCSADALSVIYFPQLGYLIAIQFDSGESVASSCAVGDDAGLSFQFQTSSTTYYKNDMMFGTFCI